MIDSYTYWDPYNNGGRFSFLALDYGDNIGWHTAYLQWSTNGTSWTGPVAALVGNPLTNSDWDFPSMAVGNGGRIVVGASKLAVSQNAGYWTAYSTDGGATWNGPNQVGTLPGATSRVVWSSSGFHVFIQDTSNASSYVLRHWSSPDGVTWAQQSDIATFGMPVPSSPDIVCPGGSCGQLYYATTPDAVASSGLGWVVAYPVNIGGRNAINVSTELGGGVTINYTTDLFSHGITTSDRGDWYLSYQTYSGGDQVLPIQEGVVYRTAGASYLGATICPSAFCPSIDPSGWYYLNQPGRCSGTPCYASGDFFRPASNIYTGASVPFVLPSSSNFTDLKQAFIQDPQAGNVPRFLPHIEPYTPGTDLRPRAVLTPHHVDAAAKLAGRPVASLMVYEALRQAHRVN